LSIHPTAPSVDRRSTSRHAWQIVARLFACCGAIAALFCGPVRAAYPDHPLTIVVPYSPGGGVDGVARIFARALGVKLGQSVVVENRPGAGAMIGIDYVSRANADGYTLLVVDPAFVINPSLQSKVSYRIGDLAPLSILTASPLVLVTSANSRIHTLEELLAIGKAQSSGITYATPGVGTTPHMAGEMLRVQQGAHLVHVPYKGSGPALTDVLSGQIDVGFMSITAASAYLKQQRFRGLATTGEERAKALSTLPTIAEITHTQYSVLFWVGLFVPAKVPDDVMRKLGDAVQAVYADPSYVKSLTDLGETPVGSRRDNAAGFVSGEFKKWAQVISAGNIKANE
jgi:tripartite-type tricarboxylate transporter receptor subunit TctC